LKIFTDATRIEIKNISNILQLFKNPTKISSHLVMFFAIFKLIKREIKNKNKITKNGKTIKIKSENKATKSYPLLKSKTTLSTTLRELSNPDKFICKMGKKRDINKKTKAVIEKER